MNKKIHVATSPLTNTIYAGSIAKDGRSWLSNKTDVTGEACAAVAQHVINFGKPLIITRNGEPCYEITVKELVGKS